MNPTVIAHVKRYTFQSKQLPGKGLTDKELIEKFGEAYYEDLLKKRVEQKRRRGMKLDAQEERVWKAYPEIEEELMRDPRVKPREL